MSWDGDLKAHLSNSEKQNLYILDSIKGPSTQALLLRFGFNHDESLLWLITTCEIVHEKLGCILRAMLQ